MNDLYKRSFDKLQPSENFKKELLESMEHKKPTLKLKKCLILAAALIAAIALLTVAVSASGALRTIRIWIDGREYAVRELDPESYHMDADGNMTITLEGKDEGEIRVEIEDLPDSGDIYEELSGEQNELPDIRGLYEQTDGRDYLVLSNFAAGEAEYFDITDELTDGVYHGELEAFGVLCTVDLRVQEDTVSLSLSVDQPE